MLLQGGLYIKRIRQSSFYYKQQFWIRPLSIYINISSYGLSYFHHQPTLQISKHKQAKLTNLTNPTLSKPIKQNNNHHQQTSKWSSLSFSSLQLLLQCLPPQHPSQTPNPPSKTSSPTSSKNAPLARSSGDSQEIFTVNASIRTRVPVPTEGSIPDIALVGTTLSAAFSRLGSWNRGDEED